MKRLLFLVSCVLTLCTNVVSAQSSSTVDADKTEILEFVDHWIHRLIIDGDVASFKDYYPKNGIYMNIYRNKIEEKTFKEFSNNWSSTSENIKYTGYKMLPDSYVYITNDGNTAWAYITIEFEYVILKTNKKGKFAQTNLDIYIKENGKWVNHTSLTESTKAERKVAVVDKSILDEYNGTYKFKEYGAVYTVSNDGKNLIFSWEGKLYTYIPQSEVSFFIKDEPQSIVFNRNKKGKVIGYTRIADNECYIVNKIDN